MSLRLILISLIVGFLVAGCSRSEFSDRSVVPLADSDVSLKDSGMGPNVAANTYPSSLPAPPVLAESAYGGGVERYEPVAYGGAGGTSGTIVGDEAPEGPYRLDTGDRLRIFVYGQPNLSRLYVVDQEGRIAVPLIGQVRARGKTTIELQTSIQRKLGTQYVKDPNVTVDIQQNRPFFIYGEVKTAGQYPYVSGMTVENAIAIAGGFTDRANERKFRIKRRLSNGYIDQIEAPYDYAVKPGDTVYVAERFF